MQRADRTAAEAGGGAAQGGLRGWAAPEVAHNAEAILRLTAALGDKQGGAVPVDPSDKDGLRTQAPVFLLDVVLPELPAVENTALPLMLGGTPRRRAVSEATRWFEPLGLAGIGRIGTGVDDGAPARAGKEVRQRRPSAKQMAAQIDREGAVEHAQIHGQRIAVLKDRTQVRRVDMGPVQPAESRHSRGKGLLHRGFVCDIDSDRKGFVTLIRQPRGQGLGGGQVDVGQADPGAFDAEPLGRGGADPGACPDHDDGPSRQPVAHPPSLPVPLDYRRMIPH